MRISVIVAIDNNYAIGKNNKLLYYIPEDLKRFKNLTTGNTIIMGRKTFLSLPKGALPNRRNIVLSSKKDAHFEGADHFTSLDLALKDCKYREQVLKDPQAKEIFIIGGQAVYKKAINIADRLCITHIDAITQDADTFFPQINMEEWKQTLNEKHLADEKNIFNYSFIDMERIRDND